MFLKSSLRIISLSMVALFPVFAQAPTAVPSTIPSINLEHLQLQNAWVRPGNAYKNTAAYLTIQNPDLTPDKLLKVECELCDTTELHDHLNENGIMKMRPVKEILLDKPETELKPGSLHIMLMGLKKDLAEGERVPLTLTFEKAGIIKMDFLVKKPTPKVAS